MIIGVTGTTGAGKDTLAHYLAGKGFCHISLSNLIREELAAKGIPLTRKNLQDYGTAKRKDLGLGVWAQKALSRMDIGKNYVITSIRNPGEVKTLANSGKLVLVAVDAPEKLRFARVADRIERSENDAATFADFKKAEARELESELAARQQMAECIAMAQFNIANDRDFGAFFEKIDGILAGIGSETGGRNII
jgi:dephospho-CoA kinase